MKHFSPCSFLVLLPAVFYSVVAVDDLVGGFDSAMVIKLMGAAAECQIDVVGTAMQLGQAASDPGNMDMEGMSKFLNGLVAPIDDICSESDEETFRGAMEDFKQCSGVDLEKVLETWPSASIGEILHCASSSVKTIQALLTYDYDYDINPPQLPKVVPSDECLEATFGPNPIGDFSRTMWKNPEVICGCFGEFSKATPDCTLEEWPIPLVGNFMRKTSCMLNKAVCPMLDTFCESELNILDRCLPAADKTSDDYDCDAVETACDQDPDGEGDMPTLPSLLNFPQEMTGAPMPDTCQKVAAYAQFKSKDMVNRYNLHLDKCVTKWEGWSDDYVSPDITATNMMASRSGGVETKVVKQAWGGFFGGMVVASVLFVGLAAFLYKTNNRVVQNVAGYNFMNQNGIELS